MLTLKHVLTKTLTLCVSISICSADLSDWDDEESVDQSSVDQSSGSAALGQSGSRGTGTISALSSNLKAGIVPPPSSSSSLSVAADVGNTVTPNSLSGSSTVIDPPGFRNKDDRNPSVAVNKQAQEQPAASSTSNDTSGLSIRERLRLRQQNLKQSKLDTSITNVAIDNKASAPGDDEVMSFEELNDSLDR